MTLPRCCCCCCCLCAESSQDNRGIQQGYEAGLYIHLITFTLQMSLSQQNLAELVAAILPAVMSTIQQQTQTQPQSHQPQPQSHQETTLPNLTTATGLVDPSVRITKLFLYFYNY